MNYRAGCVLAASAGLAMTACAAAAALPDYSTSVIAIPGQNGLPFDIAITNETPSINNNRDVAFAFLDSNGDDGVFITRGGVGQVVRLTAGFVGDVRINDNGDAVWREFFSTTDGVWVSLDGSSGSSVLTSGPLGTDSWSTPHIDESQRVGYRAGFGGQAQAYVSLVGGSFNTHATSTAADVNSPYSFLYTPSMNDGLQIAGKVDTGSPGSNISQIRVFNANGSSSFIASTTGDDAGAVFGGFDNAVSLNNNGQVGFIARDVDFGGGQTGDGVFVSDGVDTLLIGSTLDPILSDIQFFHPVLSDSGIVAFYGLDLNGNEALFAGDGTDLVRVLGAGDAVMTPDGVRFVAPDRFGGNPSINAAGDIAFNVFLNNADGSEYGRVIGIAAVPAPGTAGLLAAAGLIAARRRRGN